ncbi:MAG: hypothetical protein PHH26_04815 [Candidatus Thermoplasmatota archaeon]|nr:hypothetical protein [Candidatus Thermoplasmatota archaeon]
MGRRTIPIILLCVFLLCPIVAAQTPWPSSAPYRVDISIPGSAIVDYLGSTTLDITIVDESYDAYGSQGIDHTVTLKASVVSNNSIGWGAMINPDVITGTSPGNIYHSKVTIVAGSMVRSQTAIVNITAKVEGWATAYDYAQIFVSVNSTPRYTVFPVDAPIVVKPYSDISYQVKIVNYNVYPQTFKVWAQTGDGWKAVAQSYIALQPLESGYINVSIESPDSQFYFRGNSGLIQVFVEPDGEPEYRQMVPLVATVKGVYLSPWFYYVWLPILMACFLLSGLAVARKVEKEHNEQVAACGRKPKKKGFTDEEKARIAQVKKEKPQVYVLLMQKRNREYDIQLQKYNMCVRIYKQKKALLAEKRHEIAKAKSADSVAERKALANKRKEERKLAKEKHAAEKKLKAAKQKLEHKANKIKRKEEAKNAKLNGKQRAKMQKELAKKKKELGKLSAEKTKEAEKKRQKLLKEIEKKKKRKQPKESGEAKEDSSSMSEGGRIG